MNNNYPPPRQGGFTPSYKAVPFIVISPEHWKDIGFEPEVINLCAATPFVRDILSARGVVDNKEEVAYEK